MRYKSLFGFLTPMEKKPKNVFYAFIDGRQTGPMSETELKILVRNGSVTSSTLIWMPQLEQWTQAQLIPVVNKLLLLAKKQTPTPSSIEKIKDINPNRTDLINAVIGLGYKKNESISLVDKVLTAHPSISLEDGIKETLKLMR